MLAHPLVGGFSSGDDGVAEFVAFKSLCVALLGAIECELSDGGFDWLAYARGGDALRAELAHIARGVGRAQDHR